MFDRLKYLAKAFRNWDRSDEPSRSDRLLEQYYRARALPDWAVSTRSNPRWKDVYQVDVSVIVTCYNYSAHIGRAIESVFASAGEGVELELIVVDDASKDASVDVVRAALSRSPVPMRVVRNWWNVGVSRSRNLGVGQARGRYVFTLDADNWLHPEGIRALYAEAERCDADAAFGSVHRVKPDGSPDGIVSNEAFDAVRLRDEGPYIDAMALFRKSTLLGIGGYNVELLKIIGGWEDYALWLALAEEDCSIVFVKQQIGAYLVKSNSMLCQISDEEFLGFRSFARERFTDFTAYDYLQ